MKKKDLFKIVVGSLSDHKVQAVEKACANIGVMMLDIEGVKTASGINEQPEGLDEGYIGAFNRAETARKEYPDRVAIGIESFITSISVKNHENALVEIITLDMACIVVIDLDGREIITTSSGIVFPEDCVYVARSKGFDYTTVGSIIAKRYGGDGTDPHAQLTEQRVTRMVTLVSAIEVALRQLGFEE